MKTDADVIIVGAGPAGSACALQLARAGFRVCLVDRAQFPRTKPCGEYLNLGALDALDALGLRDALIPFARCVAGIRLFGSGASVDVPFERPAWSLSRLTFDDVLLRAALQAGATFERAHVENVCAVEGGMHIDLRDPSGEMRTLRTRFLVAADGANSTVGRKLGSLRRARGRVKFALGGHYEGFERLGDRIEMYVAGEAYFAVNPLSSHTANVMVVVEAPALHVWRDDVEGNLRRTARALGADRRDLEKANLLGKRVAIGPLAPGYREVTQGNALFVGDAAAFVDPFTGQGVLLALHSAATAARAIEETLSGVRAQTAAWEIYTRAHAKLVRDRRMVAALVACVVRNPLFARTAALVANYTGLPFRPLVRAVSGSQVLS